MHEYSVKIARRIEAEQDALEVLIDSVDRLFQERPDGIFADWRLEFIWELRDFRNALVKHFDLEEDGGFMEDVMELAPREKRQVDLLKAEHAEFLLELDAITRRVKQSYDPSIVGQLRPHIDKLLKNLRDHERSERVLISDVYHVDIGAMD